MRELAARSGDAARQLGLTGTVYADLQKKFADNRAVQVLRNIQRAARADPAPKSGPWPRR
jgi:hypothetical protein